MRSLNLTHESRLQDPENEDSGAVLIWVALMMIVLLGVGAIVIDVGALYVEQRQLQNGADAASLAVAQDCAGGDCGGDGGSARANQYADLNANDGASAVEPTTPCGVGPGLGGCAEPAPSGADGATGWVRVNTSTETGSGGTEVSFLLAPFISALTGQTVHASAVAAWGPASTATALPFTFSECEFQELSNGDAFPSGTSIVYSKADAQGNNKPPLFPNCDPRSSPGGTVEGGFGWLNVSGGTCSVELTVGQTVTGPGQPGNSNLMKKSPCSEALIQNGEEVLLPLFNAVTGTGNNVVYTIAGFVGFIVTSYHLSGSTWPSGFSCPPPPGNSGGVGNLRCFQGQFTETVVSGTDFGNTYDFGARVIGIVG